MRNKTKIYLLPLLLLSVLLVACKEDSPEVYSAPDAIYFNNRTIAQVPVDTTALTFVYQPDDVDYIDVPVVIQTIGRQSAADRPFVLSVYSENAVEGMDYELITPAVIPANTSQLIYYVRVMRTPALTGEIKQIYLQLGRNEYFDTFLRQAATGNSAYPYADMLRYRIDFSDFFTVAPEGWRPEYVGAFSERKLKLLWKLFPHIAREDYYTRGAIPFNQWTYIAKTIQEYMYEQRYNPDPSIKDEDALDEDGRYLDFTPLLS